jgi:hypothetical protein
LDKLYESNSTNSLFSFPFKVKGEFFMSNTESFRLRNIKESERKAHILVPDPLLGVIEGKNRQERYHNFVAGVLSKIWPSGSQSGEYGDDFHRSTRFMQGDQNAYTHFSPRGLDPQHIDPDAFEVAVNHIGTPDYVRVRSVPPQLLDPNISIIPTGGSCVIETHGMRTTSEIQAGIRDGVLNPGYLTQVTRALVDIAPTITHISGAILGGHPQAVHYVESDMWASRIASYGIPVEEAQTITSEAYLRINEAIKRRAKLINPQSTYIDVNFDELGLPEAIGEWFRRLDLQYTGDHRIIEVIHTYVGPEQLSLLKNVLTYRINCDHLGPQEKEAAQSMIGNSLHVRMKQIDHLRWGSMNLPKGVIMGSRDMMPEEKEQYESDFPYRMGIKVMQDVFNTHTDGSTKNAAVGFADLPTTYNGVQHESRNVGMQFTGKPGSSEFTASVQSQLTNPARLHRGNVEEHLNYLGKYIADNQAYRQMLITEMSQTQAHLAPFTRALKEAEKRYNVVVQQIGQYERTRSGQENIVMLVDVVVSPDQKEITDELKTVASALRAQKEKALLGVQKKVQDQSPDAETVKDLLKLPWLITALREVEAGRLPELSGLTREALEEIKSNASKQVQEVSRMIGSKTAELREAEEHVRSARSTVEQHQDAQDRLTQIRLDLEKMTAPSCFPLCDNPFIHHSMQFLWDSDFTVFMSEAVNIQEKRTRKELSRDQANETMRNLMGKIYPKLEAYILYLYGRIEYPYQLRHGRVFE